VITKNGIDPIPRHECALIEVKDKLYLLGGRGIHPVEVYDPKTNLWVKKAAPPIEIHHFQPITYNGYIIIIGGMTGPYPNEVPIPNMMIYNPDKDLWIVGDSIPAARLRGAGGTVVYNEKFYWIGGIKNGHIGDHKDYFDEYDPTIRKWRVFPDAPRARDHFEALVVGDEMYVTGGRRTKAPFGPFTVVIPEIDVYNFNTEEWNTLDEKLPTPRSGTSSVIWDDYLLIAGGEDPYSFYASSLVEGLNLEDNTWKEFTTLPSGRHGSGLISYKESLYLTCGKRAKKELTDIGDLWVLTQ
jgi:N-acetylneuraminic acid mutarotase